MFMDGKVRIHPWKLAIYGDVPLYDQSAIDALQAEVDRLEEKADDYRAMGDLMSQLIRAEERIKRLESANIAYSRQVLELMRLREQG